MRAKTFRLAKSALVTFFGIAFLAILGRLEWASMTPDKPSWMPPQSVWVSGPHTPLEFHRVGRWVGCTADTPPFAKCLIADARGDVIWEGRTVRLSGKDLRSFSVRPGADAFSTQWSRKQNRIIWMVRLTDDDLLVPPNDVDEVRTATD